MAKSFLTHPFFIIPYFALQVFIYTGAFFTYYSSYFSGYLVQFPLLNMIPVPGGNFAVSLVYGIIAAAFTTFITGALAYGFAGKNVGGR